VTAVIESSPQSLPGPLSILLKRGTALTPETLFPFSLITLAQTVKTLEPLNVAVEVVGIPEDASPAGSRPGFLPAAQPACVR
jgi:hypothetical protein